MLREAHATPMKDKNVAETPGSPFVDTKNNVIFSEKT